MNISNPSSPPTITDPTKNLINQSAEKKNSKKITFKKQFLRLQLPTNPYLKTSPPSPTPCRLPILPKSKTPISFNQTLCTRQVSHG
jgi:hypothetical protein